MAASSSQSGSARPLIVTDGSLDWSNGVNSIKATTLVSVLNVNGLARSELAWLDNGTVRGGGITQRPGWVNRGALPSGIYQGAETYQPDTGYPYQIAVIGGNVYRIDPDNVSAVVNLSAQFNLTLPLVQRVYFCQAENYLIIQAGDGQTFPLFWDGNRMWRSVGITNPLATNASGPHVNEIPPAGNMCYYMGRVWYARGRSISAGDIVSGPSGWPAGNPYFNNQRDSVLCVQENPLCVGGDGFMVPTTAGLITGVAYASNINTQLGEGTLYIGTRQQVYSLTVPITRTSWIASTANNMPLMVVALVSNGWVNDRSIVSVNGDLFFQSLDPAIRSLTTAVRNFGSWGNVAISINEYRVLQYNDRSLMWSESGVYFDNRLLQTALPYVCPVGVAHKAIIPLNFDVISSLWGQLQQSQNTGSNLDSPAWEGIWEGLNVLELKSEDFSGLDRAFAYVWSDANSQIQLWELIPSEKQDNDDNRVTWRIEFPSFTWGSEFELKEMVSAELWLDKVSGTVEFTMEFRPDSDTCPYPWHKWKVCSARDSNEALGVNSPYPTKYGPGYQSTITLPNPLKGCNSFTGRPPYIAYQIQPILTIKGYCRVRGLILHATLRQRELYSRMVC